MNMIYGSRLASFMKPHFWAQWGLSTSRIYNARHEFLSKQPYNWRIARCCN